MYYAIGFVVLLAGLIMCSALLFGVFRSIGTDNDAFRAFVNAVMSKKVPPVGSVGAVTLDKTGNLVKDGSIASFRANLKGEAGTMQMSVKMEERDGKWFVKETDPQIPDMV